MRALTKILLVTLVSSAYAQRSTLEHQIFRIDKQFDMAVYAVVEGHHFYQYDYVFKDPKKRIFLDNKPLDSSKLYFSMPAVLSKGKLYATASKMTTGSNVGQLYEIDLERKLRLVREFKDEPWPFPIFDFYFTYPQPHDSVIYKIEPSTGNSSVFIDKMPDLVLGPLDVRNFFFLAELFAISKNKLLMMFSGDCHGGCLDNYYAVYDIKTKTYSPVKWLNELANQERNSDKSTGYSRSFIRLDVGLAVDFEKGNSYGTIRDSATPNMNGTYIFNEAMEILTPALSKAISGTYNYEKGKIESIMLQSTLDDGKAVFVPYKFSLALERSFYRIYNDSILNSDDQKTLTKYDLDILKNFILTKHNYQFTSEFYQAYFNVFEFYNSPAKKSKRLSQVEGLFTLADKKNMEIIMRGIDGSK